MENMQGNEVVTTLVVVKTPEEIYAELKDKKDVNLFKAMKQAIKAQDSSLSAKKVSKIAEDIIFADSDIRGATAVAEQSLLAKKGYLCDMKGKEQKNGTIIYKWIPPTAAKAEAAKAAEAAKLAKEELLATLFETGVITKEKYRELSGLKPESPAIDVESTEKGEKVA